MSDPANRLALRPYGPSDPHWVGRLVGHFHDSWKAGTPLLPEAYLEAIPELTSEPEEAAGFPALGQLVDAELTERQRLGQPLAAGLLGGRLRRFVLPGFRHAEFVKPFPGPPIPFGPYDLLTRLGRGAFGVVSLARDRQLDRDVAVKQIEFTQRPNAQPVDEKALESRFKKEARAAGALEHPNLIRLNAFDDAPPMGLYLEMGYEPGPSLGGYTRGGGNGPTLLPADRAAVLILTHARAMAYAHGFGILHRDLKPDNIRFDRYGHPVIVDFGLARVPVPLSTTSTYSQTNTVLGTFRYAAPEVYRAEYTPVGDVYSLGVVLFELLTGTVPFDGPKGVEVLVRKNREDAHFPENTGVSPVLIDVCLTALEREPEKRFQSMHAFADALGEYLAGAVLSIEIPGRTFIVMPPPRRKRRWLVPAVAATTLGLGIGGGSFIPREFEPKPNTVGESKPATAVERPRTSPRQITVAAAAYLATVPNDKLRTTRFLTVQPLDRPGVAPQYRDEVRTAMKLVIRAIGKGDANEVTVVPGSDEMLLAFNLDEDGWKRASWDAVMDSYPYAVEYSRRPNDLEWNGSANQLEVRTVSVKSVVRADWLIATTIQMKMKDPLAKLIGVDARKSMLALPGFVYKLADDFRTKPIDLATAAAELGLADEAPLRRAIEERKLAGLEFSNLLNGQITRKEWDGDGDLDSPFYRAIGYFKLGTAHGPP